MKPKTSVRNLPPSCASRRNGCVHRLKIFRGRGRREIRDRHQFRAAKLVSVPNFCVCPQFLYVLCLIWLAAAPVFASAQWTAAAYIGKAHTADADIRVTGGSVTDVVFNKVDFEDRAFEGRVYYGLRTGYMWTSQFGLEAEFIHMKAFARVSEPVTFTGTLPTPVTANTTVPGEVLPQYGVSHGLNLVLGNFVVRHKLTNSLAVGVRA